MPGCCLLEGAGSVSKNMWEFGWSILAVIIVGGASILIGLAKKKKKYSKVSNKGSEKYEDLVE